MRHLTVIGILTLSSIDLIHSATLFGSFIKQAPKLHQVTLGEGHPQFKLISS